MADEKMTDREIQQAFRDLREELRRGFRDVREEMRLGANAYNKRMDGFVTTDAWTRENGHLVDKIEEVDEDCRERNAAMQKAIDNDKKDKKTNWDRVPVWLSVAVALFAAIYTAYAASKGK